MLDFILGINSHSYGNIKNPIVIYRSNLVTTNFKGTPLEVCCTEISVFQILFEITSKETLFTSK